MLDGFMAANDKFAQQVNPPTRPSLLFKDAARSQFSRKRPWTR
jgi:hypothetical protein